MNHSSFLRYLLRTLLFISSLFLLLNSQFDFVLHYWDIAAISLVFYTLFSYLLYVFAAKAAKSPDINAFTAVSIYSIAIKMALSIILVFIYFKIKSPSDRNFLVPFFIIYLSFTIFETWFMMRLSKSKS